LERVATGTAGKRNQNSHIQDKANREFFKMVKKGEQHIQQKKEILVNINKSLKKMMIRKSGSTGNFEGRRRTMPE
jgi:hypothetical protein